MRSIDLLLMFYDSSWVHEWESVHAALAGITEEEAGWQPPGYPAVDPHGALPPPGTVLWHVAHLEHCVRHYTGILDTRPVTNEPETPPPAGAALPELCAALEDARLAMRAAIAAAGDDLEKPCVRSMNVAEFVVMATRHNCWHAGQIAVARRLYRNREGIR
ncbi:MAG: DinB family protein [Bacteroidetes bacterium]|nr:DinB family protein [Bacteroidota bacterium]